jgi:hypothetical protein
MGDLENRLRAAMTAAAEQPPAGLLDGIRRRHRRRIRRITAASIAAVAAAAIAAPVAAREIAGGSRTAVPPAAPARPPGAAPGTVLRDCPSSEGGTVSSGWRAHSVHAGPVWFMFARPLTASQAGPQLAAGKLTASAMAIAVENGHTAVVTAAPATGGRFRFLPRFSGGSTPYTLADGAPGLRLAGCPPYPVASGIPASYAPGLTMFWEGFVTDLRGCIPLEVRTAAGSPPIRVTIAAAAGCRRS